MTTHYAVRLTFNMLIALVDIHEDCRDVDSTRYNSATLTALNRRELLCNNSLKLTKKGLAYLEVALYEYYTGKKWLEARKASK